MSRLSDCVWRADTLNLCIRVLLYVCTCLPPTIDTSPNTKITRPWCCRTLIVNAPSFQANRGILSYPILLEAGKDISHWFDPATGDILYHTDPITNLRLPFCPQGRFVHVPPPTPTTNWDMSYDTPWWLDAEKYCIGRLSARTRRVRIKNVLTAQKEHELEVPSEETVSEIRERYLVYNTHAASYIWKTLLPKDGANTGDQGEDDFEFVTLDMEKTLGENGVTDYEMKYEEMGAMGEVYIPVIHLYYTDDLTEA